MGTAKPSTPQAAADREEILSCLRERIVAFAASRLSRDVAEDLAQEVLLVLHEKYATVTRLEDLLPLSLQILRFKLIAFRRKTYRHREYNQVSVDEVPLADGHPDPEMEAGRRQRMDRLARAMEQMGERCRQIFRLKLEGKSFQEIRAVLGVSSINTIYTWDFRCRQHLLELMGGHWEAEK